MVVTEPPARTAGRTYLVLVGLGAAVGIPAALLAALFLALVHVLEGWLWHDLPEQLGADLPPWYLVIGLPTLGALVVWVARRFLPGDGGHNPIDGLNAAPTPLAHGPGIALAALGTLAFGAVLGPEAPLIALGSVVGMAVTRFVRVEPHGQAVVATAGSFSAVSALFGGPLVAGMLLLEAGIAAGAALIPMLLPGLVAAAVGYVLFVGLGDWGGLSTTALAVPGLPSYVGTHVVDLLLAIAVGAATTLLMEPVRMAAKRVVRVAPDIRSPRALWLLLAGGAAVGLLAQVARLLGADSQDVLFSGQAAIPDVVAEQSATVLLVLLVTKALGYAICLGCGFRGGPVFPALFLGSALATFAVIGLDRSPTWAVAVGAAAGMTAGTGLVFSAMLFAMLLVGGVGLDALPAAVLASVTAWIVKTTMERPRNAPAPGAATTTS